MFSVTKFLRVIKTFPNCHTSPLCAPRWSMRRSLGTSPSSWILPSSKSAWRKMFSIGCSWKTPYFTLKCGLTDLTEVWATAGPGTGSPSGSSTRALTWSGFQSSTPLLTSTLREGVNKIYLVDYHVHRLNLVYLIYIFHNLFHWNGIYYGKIYHKTCPDLLWQLALIVCPDCFTWLPAW